MSNRLKRDVKLALRFTPATTEELATRQLSGKPDGYCAGWASTPAVDSYGTSFRAGCFDASISRRGLTGPTSVKFLLNHDRRTPAGVITKLEMRGDRLWMEAQLNLEIGYVRDAHSAAKMAGGFNFSIGCLIEEYLIDRKTDVITFTRCDLREVSMVPMPGNDDCQMVEIRSAFLDEEGDEDSTSGGKGRIPETARLVTLDEDELRDVLDEPAQSLSELEKRLIAIGFVKNRTEAKNLTLVVKAHLPLFQRSKPAQEAAPSASPAQVAEPDPAILEALRALRELATAPAATK